MTSHKNHVFCVMKRKKRKRKKTLNSHPKKEKLKNVMFTNICKVGSLNGTKRLKPITLLSLVTKNKQNIPCATIHSISPFIILEANKQTF